jgi:hypothetical protein
MRSAPVFARYLLAFASQLVVTVKEVCIQETPNVL